MIRIPIYRNALTTALILLLTAWTSVSYAQFNYIDSKSLEIHPVFILKDGLETKVVGIFKNARTLREFAVPVGYHIATEDEIDNLAEEYALKGDSLAYPIYCEVIRPPAQTIKVTYTYNIIGNTYRTIGDSETERQDNPLFATVVEKINKRRKRDLSYYIDPNLTKAQRDRAHARQFERVRSAALEYKVNASRVNESYPTIKPGYVYLIKDSDMEIFDKLR